ncbi:hypothetical protein WG907_15450 [Sphingobium sp. AN558]|uniref:hypothetical protein n=1 Tax=Sphingobium sp. AN558 TaxID=3133442 RepID=UPI0030C45B35
MADTPETSPAKSPKKGGGSKVGAGTPANAAETSAISGDGASGVTSRENPDTSGASQGWAAQVAPLKAHAEKIAKSAVDTLGAVDWKSHIDPIKDQAGKTALTAAGVAKDKTGSAIQSLAKLIADTAGTVDAKLGPQYGDYARQAAESVASAARTLDSKDVDQLMGEARDFVRKSPAVAIGAAAVVGFVLMRLAKGSDDSDA